MLHDYVRFAGDGITVANVEVWDDSNAPAGLVNIDGLSPLPGIGWTFSGGVWTSPAVPLTTQNQQAINANLSTRQVQLAAFIAANLNGAVLTAAQVNILARILNGLVLLQLAQLSSSSGT